MRDMIAYALVVGFSVGIFVTSIFKFSAWDGWLFLLIGIALLVLVSKRKSSPAIFWIIPAAVFLVFLSLGIWRTTFYENSLAETTLSEVGSEVILTGVVSREPDETCQQHAFICFNFQTQLFWCL